jgi:hypothetical protein
MGGRRRSAWVAALAVLACGGWAAPSEAFVYWADATGAIGRANLDGTGVTLDFVATAARPLGVAVDGRHLYWSNPSTNAIGRANLDGSGVNQSFIATQGYPLGLAVDGEHVHWGDGGAGGIGRSNLDGSGAIPTFIANARSALGLALDGRHVYWTNSRTSSIGRANLDGSGAEPNFLASVSTAAGVAVDGRHVYWSDPSGYIRRANLDGSGVEPFFILIARGNEPGAVAVDAAHVYWVNERTATIGRANLDGTGADESFIAGVRRPVALAVDGGPAGIAVPSAASLSFKKQPVGTFGPPASVTTANEGHGNLRIDAVRVTGGDVNDFLVSHDTCSQHTLTIAAKCTVYVRFGPSATGDRQATLALTSDDPAAPLEIGLQGTGG